MTGLSLTHKLGIVGAFLVLVALAVGTEEQPGIVVAGTSDLALRRPAPVAAANAPAQSVEAAEAPGSAPVAAPVPEAVPAPPPLVPMRSPVDTSGRPAPQIDLPELPATEPTQP